MITEDFVSYETAKLLKENGFNETVRCFYNISTEIFCDDCVKTRNSYTESIAAPTLQMAMKWLEEKYGVFCVIRRHGDIDRGFTYSWNWEGRIGLSMKTEGGFVSAKEAREAAIKYCLENLI